ncbi:MAG TPA: hypothetical protein VG938_16810 [Verrucomicrobiae bacterium]|nr:hypothetical protein [Verrucomicrobiae bacterium]
MTAASTATPSHGILTDRADGVPADSFASVGGLTKDPAARTPFSTAPQIDTNATMGVLAMAAAEPETQKKLNANGTSSAASVGGIVFDSVKSETAKTDASAPQHFYRMNILSTRSAKEAGSPEPVLTSFRVEQIAGELRVVDADGSVYTGTVQVASKDIESHAVFAGAFKNAPAASSNGTLQQMPGAQNYFFRVTGTNRNLRQNIVFSGSLIPITNVFAMGTNANGTGGSGGGGAGAMPTALSPLLLWNSRISGTAVIGNQKEIEVNATPAR